MKNEEKIMERLENQKENKRGILEDMLSFIRYTPNREADILSFMERYQKADQDERPIILEYIRCCMDGKEYPNPYAEGYHYTQEDVQMMCGILDDYIDNLISAGGDTFSISECIKNTVLRINELNEKCEGYMIDTWRRERLCNFINSAAEIAGISQEKDLTLEYRMW